MSRFSPRSPASCRSIWHVDYELFFSFFFLFCSRALCASAEGGGRPEGGLGEWAGGRRGNRNGNGERSKSTKEDTLLRANVRIILCQKWLSWFSVNVYIQYMYTKALTHTHTQTHRQRKYSDAIRTIHVDKCVCPNMCICKWACIDHRFVFLYRFHFAEFRIPKPLSPWLASTSCILWSTGFYNLYLCGSVLVRIKNSCILS